MSDDARRLQTRLGGNDQRKLDEYLTGIREIERRIESAPGGNGASNDEQLAGYRVPAGVPREYAEHLRLMSDMLVLAFQTDSTRIATFMFANAGSNRSYRDVDVPDGHHDLSHHGGRREETRQDSPHQSLPRDPTGLPAGTFEVDP